jgi:hypothetical protein
MTSGFISLLLHHQRGSHKAKKTQKVNRKWHCFYFLMFFLTQQYSWAQDRIEFFLRDINAIAFNSSCVSLVHFLCRWISKYPLLPGKVENTKIKS